VKARDLKVLLVTLTGAVLLFGTPILIAALGASLEIEHGVAGGRIENLRWVNEEGEHGGGRSLLPGESTSLRLSYSQTGKTAPAALRSGGRRQSSRAHLAADLRCRASRKATPSHRCGFRGDTPADQSSAQRKQRRGLTHKLPSLVPPVGLRAPASSGRRLLAPPSSHTTVRTGPYTAVQAARFSPRHLPRRLSSPH
jgi:hypothetical protein